MFLGLPVRAAPFRFLGVIMAGWMDAFNNLSNTALNAYVKVEETRNQRGNTGGNQLQGVSTPQAEQVVPVQNPVSQEVAGNSAAYQAIKSVNPLYLAGGAAVVVVVVVVLLMRK